MSLFTHLTNTFAEIDNAKKTALNLNWAYFHIVATWNLEIYKKHNNKQTTQRQLINIFLISTAADRAMERHCFARKNIP